MPTREHKFKVIFKTKRFLKCSNFNIESSDSIVLVWKNIFKVHAAYCAHRLIE